MDLERGPDFMTPPLQAEPSQDKVRTETQQTSDQFQPTG